MNIKTQPVVRQLHLREAFADEPFVGLCVHQIMRDVRKPGAPRAQLLHEFQRLQHGLVHGVRGVAQRVKHQIIHSGDQRFGRLRQVAEIGQVGEAADAVTEDRQIAVLGWHGRPRDAQQFKRSVNGVHRNLRNSAQRGLPAEDVRKRAPQSLQRLRRSINRQRRVLPHVIRAYVIEAENMVGVGVGVNHGVESVNFCAQSLRAEIGSGINHHVAAIA